jgi:hypothetical protein
MTTEKAVTSEGNAPSESFADYDPVLGTELDKAYEELEQANHRCDELLAALKLVRMISDGRGAADLGTGQSETVLLAPKTLEQIDSAISKAEKEEGQ